MVDGVKLIKRANKFYWPAAFLSLGWKVVFATLNKNFMGRQCIMAIVDLSYRIIPLPEAQLYADFVSVKHDIITIKKCCALFIEQWDRLFRGHAENGHDVLEALGAAIAIKYARCFKSGKRNSEIPKMLLASLTVEQYKIHSELIAIRDKHLAHPVNGMEEGEFRAYFNNRDLATGITQVQEGYSMQIALNPRIVESILVICEQFLILIDSEIGKGKKEILKICQSIPAEIFLTWPVQNPIGNQIDGNTRQSAKRAKVK